MKSICLAVIVCLALAAASCRQNDYRTVAIHVPDMKNAACVEIVVRALATQQRIPGENIQVSMEQRSVTVKYDSLNRSLKNLEFAIADAGFRANDIPANEKAKAALPAECLK